jgi:hypothetical protein
MLTNIEGIEQRSVVLYGRSCISVCGSKRMCYNDKERRYFVRDSCMLMIVRGHIQDRKKPASNEMR